MVQLSCNCELCPQDGHARDAVPQFVTFKHLADEQSAVVIVALMKCVWEGGVLSHVGLASASGHASANSMGSSWSLSLLLLPTLLNCRPLSGRAGTPAALQKLPKFKTLFFVARVMQAAHTRPLPEESSTFADAKGGELETPRRENLDTPRKASSSKIFRGLKRRISRAFDGPTGKPQGETVDGDSAGSTPVTTPNSGRIRAAAPGEQRGGTISGILYPLPTAQAVSTCPTPLAQAQLRPQGQGRVPSAQAGRVTIPAVHPQTTRTSGRVRAAALGGLGWSFLCWCGLPATDWLLRIASSSVPILVAPGRQHQVGSGVTFLQTSAELTAMMVEHGWQMQSSREHPWQLRAALP